MKLGNIKKFNIYVFLSTFSRNLIEVFIPMILYKSGYDLKKVILYYFFVNFFSLILAYPCFKFARKRDYKILSFIGVVAFLIMQVMLNKVVVGLIYILTLAFSFALYRRCYWISRRHYNLNVIGNKNIAVSYSIISIINQIGVIISAYIGSLLLDFISIKALTIISILLFIISIIPLYFIETKKEKEHKKIELFKTLEKISTKKAYVFGAYELLNVVKFLFPLYIAIYVKNTYQAVGLLNLFTNLATLAFAYLYGKKINGKKNFIGLSVFLVVLVYIFKANTTTAVLVIISFLEGIVTKMLEISLNSDFYKLSKSFEYEEYNFAYEFMQNFMRTIVTLILILFVKDLKVMIYVTLAFIAIIPIVNRSIKEKDIDIKKETSKV